jgi:two-component system, sporulation sensor kinase A
MGYIVIILTLIAIALLAVKAHIKKEWGALLAAMVSRAYLAVVFILAVIHKVNFFANDSMVLGMFAIIAVLSSDVITNIVYILSRKYAKVIELDKLTSILGQIEAKNFCLLESSQAGIYVIDGNGDIEYANPTLCKLSGYTKQELLNMNVLELVSPEFHEVVKKEIAERMSGVRPYAYYDVVAITKNGESIKVHIVSSKTENGHPTITGNILEVK